MKRFKHSSLMLAAATMMAVPLASAAPTTATNTSPVTFHAWNGSSLLRGEFDTGAQFSISQGRPGLTLRPGSKTGSWTSPVYESAAVGDLVSSWQASTPTGTWIETRLSVRAGGHWSQWYQMGQWASDASTIQRTSINDQSDADGTIYTDTYVAGDNGQPTAYRLREILHSTGTARPMVYQIGATTSNLTGAPPTTSATTMTHTVDLPVPQYSQEIHAGEYPAYGGGGEVWCSPTSTAMVMAYWHKGPSAADLATLPADPTSGAHGRPDPQVDWAAIHTWDIGYEGTGNWPFNTAYASSYGLDGSVRQYASLRDIESWIKRGVPIVVSIAWNNTDASPDNDLTGAPIAKTGGHLMVVRGFTAAGDVIAGDPAAPANSSVRRVYQRSQFERDWLNASTGTTYVIKPSSIRG
ncbi:MAG TPA: C39 family peptidase [Candidatus Saccharimonadia bacterium]|nr:C39 family peptidase [Candidatus Saccharimonadia bacterium]